MNAIVRTTHTSAGHRPAGTLLRGLVWLLCLLACTPAPGADAQPDDDAVWFAQPPQRPAVTLYFFWSSRCPHCQDARPFVESLTERHPWISVRSLEILEDAANRARFVQLAERVGFVPQSVPTFVWCGEHASGYADDATTGQALLDALRRCYAAHYGEPPPVAAAQPAVSDDAAALSGGLDPPAHSLFVLAVTLGAMDAFNPCAFFVLLFLLSLLVNTHSRARMLLVGGLFVAVSGLVYFAFMAAWLNLFQWLGTVRLITFAAGAIALLIAAINIKDYVRPGRGPSLGVSDGHRARLFARMRGLLGGDRLPALLAATLTLALAANTYELLCTLGLPMVFTRTLTLHELPGLQYYAYLALYNLVYVTPLAVIVGLFVATMGRRKLSASEGRFLKLLSGLLMAVLGLLLVWAPERMSDTGTALGLVALALLVSLGVHALYRRSET